MTYFFLIPNTLAVNMTVHFDKWIFHPILMFKHKKPNFAQECMSSLSLVPEFLRKALFPLCPQYKQWTDRQDDLIKQGRDVKKSTTVLDFMDYWRLLRPAGRGIILVSLLNWMRVSGTGVSRVKVIGLTSEYHVCNPLVWYLCALAGRCSLSWLLVFVQRRR